MRLNLLTIGAVAALATGPALAETNLATPPSAPPVGHSEGQEDPKTQIAVIEQRTQVRDGVFPSPIQGFRDEFSAWKDGIYQQTGLKLGFSFHTVFQYADNVIPDTSDTGWATDFDFVGAWELLNRGAPTQGELHFGLEGRWNYGRTGPQTIGLANIGAAGGSANSFEAYSPNFILRNLFWHQGSAEAGWEYRLGKITTDAILAVSRHLSPNATFLSNAGTGLFVNSYADSGLGAVGTVYFNAANGYVRAAITDSNGDRFDWGDISEGDFYTALELGYKILPRTKNAGYSKLTIWHTDGTKDGTPINGNTGESGWGYSLLLEQELSADGNIVAVGRYGNSNDGAAIYDEQAALAFLFYQPFGWFDSDAVGLQYNYIDPAGEMSRDEHTFEAFYRFPLVPDLETTLAYQYIDTPGNTTEINSSNVFSLRFTTSF